MADSKGKPNPDLLSRAMGFLFDFFQSSGKDPNFKRIHASGIRSSEGFIFEYKDKDTVRYFENGKSLSISREMGSPGAIYLSNSNSWDGTQERVTPDKKEVIKERIGRALKHLKSDDKIE